MELPQTSFTEKERQGCLQLEHLPRDTKIIQKGVFHKMFYRRWVLTLMERNQEWVGLKEEPLLMTLYDRCPEERLSHK